MPGYKVHLATGIITPVAISYILKDITPGLAIGVISSGVGSLLPDMDADYSKIRHMLPRVAKLYDKLPKNLIFKHRGLLLHSVLTLIPFIYLYYVFYNWLTLGLLMGIITHHLLDGLTPAGLPHYFVVGGRWLE